MTINPVDSSRGTIVVDTARTRQTAPPDTPFRQALASSVNVLMSGAEIATSVVAGPVLAAAVDGARTSLVGEVAGPPSSVLAAVSPGVAAAPFTATAALAAGGAGGPDMAGVQAMQRESEAFNMQLLALQEQVQDESQRFSTISNVLRAKHDTAKAAISNLRS